MQNPDERREALGASRRQPRSMPASDPIDALADVESQAASWSREERLAEVDDRAVEAYRSVTLAGRLVASIGRAVVVDVHGAERVRGRLAGAGDGWLVVDDGSPVLVLGGAVLAVSGVADTAASAAAWPLASRRSVAAVLSRLGEDGAVTVTTLDGRRLRGALGRVGADFVELDHTEASGSATADGPVLLVPLSALATVRQSSAFSAPASL